MINFYFKTDPNQHICELQLAHSQMYTARKQFPGHAVYNKVRNAIEMSKLFGTNKSVNEDVDNDDSSDDGDDDSDDSSTSLRFRATRFKGQQVQTTANDLVNVIEISNELLDDNDCKDGLEYQGGVRQDDSLARCQKPTCEIKEEKEGETTPTCTACVFPRPVRDMVTKQCRKLKYFYATLYYCIYTVICLSITRLFYISRVLIRFLFFFLYFVYVQDVNKLPIANGRFVRWW